MIRILIADDHPVVRRGLKQTIAEIPDAVTVDEATDGMEALSKVKNGELRCGYSGYCHAW